MEHGLLHRPEYRVHYEGEYEAHNDSDIPRSRSCNRTLVPRLRHARHDNTTPAEKREQGCEARGELARCAPLREVVQRPVVPSEDEVLCNDDRGENGAPIADNVDYVDEGRVEVLCADNRDRD